MTSHLDDLKNTVGAELSAQVSQGQEEKDMMRSKISEIAADLAASLGSINQVQTELGAKAANSEVTEAVSSVKDRLQVLADNMCLRDGLEAALEQKFDKKDLMSLTEALKGGGQTVDLGKPFFAVYTCNKPYKSPGLAGLYAGDLTTVETQDDILSKFAGPSVDTSVLPEVQRRDIKTAGARPTGMEDGASMSRYPRMMPPAVRIRTTAGGGVPG
eukprot:FR737441.1.p1 GENE.FR737441.1~~FR737441.1.p1  ORF type:complete len:235 (+),score=21.67 FR737441.1:63-707(+)